MLCSLICNAGGFYTSLEKTELNADKQMHKKGYKDHSSDCLILRCC